MRTAQATGRGVDQALGARSDTHHDDQQCLDEEPRTRDVANVDGIQHPTVWPAIGKEITPPAYAVNGRMVGQGANA